MITAAVGSEAVYLGGGDIFVADFYAYFAPPQFHLLGHFVKPFYDRLSGNQWEATVYLGLVNILVLRWLWHATRGKDTRPLTYVLWGMAVFAILASGDSLHFVGFRTIPMPNAFLSELPFFRNVRTPSRAVVFVYLFLSIGIGHAVNLAWSRRKQASLPGEWPRYHAHRSRLLPCPASPHDTVACSPGLAVIRDDPEPGFGVLDLPNGNPPGYIEGNFYMLQQTCHGRPIAQGNTSRNMVRSLRDDLESQDLDAQRRQLITAKLKYIVVHHQYGGSPVPLAPRRWGRRSISLDLPGRL